jgi:hypothetical protein
MTGGSDKVEQRMHTVISETRVSLDSRLLGQNVVVLAFEVSDDFAKGSFVIDLISKARGINNGE